MVDIACSIRKRLAVKSVAVIQMKNISIAGFQTTSALFASNLFSNVGNNPRTFGDILHCKQPLPVNTGFADTYHISPFLGATSGSLLLANRRWMRATLGSEDKGKKDHLA